MHEQGKDREEDSDLPFHNVKVADNPRIVPDVLEQIPVQFPVLDSAKDENFICPLFKEYIGALSDTCKKCEYPFCIRNVTVAPPQEQEGSEGSGSDVDRKEDSRHGEFCSERMKLIKEELQFGIDNDQHTVDPRSQTDQQTMTPVYDAGEFDRLPFDILVEHKVGDMEIQFPFPKQSQKDQAAKMYWVAVDVLNKIKEEIEKRGLFFSFIKTEHDEHIIVISEKHSPIDGIYIAQVKPTE